MGGDGVTPTNTGGLKTRADLRSAVLAGGCACQFVASGMCMELENFYAGKVKISSYRGSDVYIFFNLKYLIVTELPVEWKSNFRFVQLLIKAVVAGC